MKKIHFVLAAVLLITTASFGQYRTLIEKDSIKFYTSRYKHYVDSLAFTAAINGKLTKASNLADLTSPSTARTNLGLGSLATQNGTFSGTSSGTNTGDETGAGIKSKLEALTGSNRLDTAAIKNLPFLVIDNVTVQGGTSEEPLHVVGSVASGLDSIKRGTYATMPHNIILDTVTNRIWYKSGSFYYKLSIADSVGVAGGGGGGGGGSFSSITMDLQHANLDDEGSNYYGYGPGSGDPTGASSKHFASGTDGRIYFISEGAATDLCIMTVLPSHALTGYNAGINIGVYTYAGTIYVHDDGYGGLGTTTGVSVASGNYVSIVREGSVWKLQKSTDAGATWTDVYTYSLTSTGTKYVGLQIFDHTHVRVFGSSSLL